MIRVLAPLLLLAVFSPLAQSQELLIDTQDLVLDGIRFESTITAVGADGNVDHAFTGIVDMQGAARADGSGKTIQFRPEDGGRVSVELVVDRSGPIDLVMDGNGLHGSVSVRSIPGILSLIPPLLAILLAILFRQVVVALIVGIFAGALLVNNLDPARMIYSLTDTYLIRAITGVNPPAAADTSHTQIIVFSLLLGGMVGVISRSGGTNGIVRHLARFARTRRSGQVATAALGSSIFFDDYANCLLVGNTMRPLTDRLRISREKLAYIVDSTAAPVASLIPLSTWVGYQVGLVGDALGKLPGGYHISGYAMILESIPYMFYPIFALLLVYLVGSTGRDMFTMVGAERRAFHEGKVLRDGSQPLAAGEGDSEIRMKTGVPQRAVNALIPILGVVIVTMVGIYITGRENAVPGDGFFANLKAIVQDADSYVSLLWASITGVLLASVLAVSQRILSLDEAATSCIAGMKSMFLAVVILVLSWALSDVTSELHAEAFLSQQLEGTVGATWLPLLVFMLGAFTAFATGSSWGTMGILIPIVIPLTFNLCGAAGLDAGVTHSVLLGSIASVLGGAVFGDHCSPISDTTVLSSMASSCDHIDHVRTQTPYALMAAIFATAAGYVPAALGASILYTLPIGIILLIVAVKIGGRTIEDDPTPA